MSSKNCNVDFCCCCLLLLGNLLSAGFCCCCLSLLGNLLSAGFSQRAPVLILMFDDTLLDEVSAVGNLLSSPVAEVAAMQLLLWRGLRVGVIVLVTVAAEQIVVIAVADSSSLTFSKAGLLITDASQLVVRFEPSAVDARSATASQVT